MVAKKKGKTTIFHRDYLATQSLSKFRKEYGGEATPCETPEPESEE